MTSPDTNGNSRAPWWNSLTGLVYFAANCGLIYAFLLWPLQQGAELTMNSVVIWAVLTVFAALLYLWARRSAMGGNAGR